MTGAGVTVCPALPEDVPGITALDRAVVFAGHWSEHGYRELLDNRLGVLLKAELDGVLAGFLAGRIIPPEAELDNIAVPDFLRRRGAGRALLAEFIKQAQKAGCSAIFLEVNERNSGALEFYGRTGFRSVGRRPKFYSGIDDAILMRCECE
ncbi:MAG: GNAT family N-acetyltransferase [Elusimicrobiaceae bacterium]|nr:GNAT family N-acetyltransferase [Elusimicrobiaceae bacterium]